MLRNTENAYGTIAKIFHWVISFSIIALIAVGLIMEEMVPSPEKFELYAMHKAAGVSVFMLIILRVLWRFSNKVVKPPANLPIMLKLGASAGHFLLYIFMFLMPISGILMSHFGGHDISMFGMYIITAAIEKNMQLAGLAHEIHTTAIWGFIAIIVLHIVAALYHHFIRRDNILLRMLNK